MKRGALKLVEYNVMRPVTRKPNRSYRTREHLIESEIGKLLAALKQNRHGQRDSLVGLLIYRHGLRVSEACDLRWDDIDLTKRTIAIRRLKGSTDSAHYLERDELAGLKRLQREQGSNAGYVFLNERGQPFQRMGVARTIERAGEAAFRRARPHAEAQHWLHSGRQGHGHKAVAALPRPRRNNKHRQIHRHEPRTV